MFTVVVSFFSGRNNPEWVVKNNRALTELMVNARKEENFGLPAQMPGRLGYRGILVEDNITKIPGLLVGPKSTKLQLELLRNIPEKMKFKSGDLEEIINTIRGGKIDFEKAPIFQVRGKRYAPPYHPAWWNAWSLPTGDKGAITATTTRLCFQQIREPSLELMVGRSIPWVLLV